MEIIADNLGKRFNNEWIFRNMNLNFQIGKSYAVTGPNGSGKSTLLQVISGIVPPSEGDLSYFHNTIKIIPDDFYNAITIATPHQEVIEEFTLSELLNFHLKFKDFRSGMNKEAFCEKLKLSSSKDKEIKFFSSGMKQRVKLGLALFSKSEILILDEPTSNLDKQGIDWYQEEIVPSIKDRLVIIGSNQKYEYSFCNEIIELVIRK